MSSIDFMNEWEPGNIFKRQRSRRRWRLLQPWERDRVSLMYREYESDRELHSTVEYSKPGTRGRKRKRKSTGPFIPSAEQLPNNNMTDAEIIFDDPVLYDTSNTNLAADMDPEPNLTEDLSNNNSLEINPLANTGPQPNLGDDISINRNPLEINVPYYVWFALRQLMERLQTSIQQQLNSLDGQRIAFQQLIEQLQTSIQQQYNSLDGQIVAFRQLIEQLQTSIQQQQNSFDGQIIAFRQLEQAVIWFQSSLFQTQ